MSVAMSRLKRATEGGAQLVGFGQFGFVLVLAGHLGWMATYVLFILAGLRDSTYSVPFVSICLNFAWELYYIRARRPDAETPKPMRILFYTVIAWLVLDVGIFLQLLNSRHEFADVPFMSNLFYLVVFSVLLTALFAQHFFNRSAKEFGDMGVSGLLVNLVMSTLFIVFYFRRAPDYHGLSSAAAWAKMLSTAIIVFGLIALDFSKGARLAERPDDRLGYFLAFVVFLLDMLYIWLLSPGIVPITVVLGIPLLAVVYVRFVRGSLRGVAPATA